MINNLFAILGALAAVGCASSGQLNSIDDREFETKVISRGNNFPPFRFDDIHAGKVVVLIREGVAESQIREHEFADGVTGGQALDALIQDGFLVRSASGELWPTLTVMTISAVSKYMRVDADIIDETTEAILSYAPEAFDTVSSLEGFSHLSHDQYDLFLLSNGLLDNFQIGNVEAQLIKSERPERAGGKYYLAVREKDPASVYETFGIYGNNTSVYGKYIVGVYGNQRNDQTNFHRMREKLYLSDTVIDDKDLRLRREELAQAMAAAWLGEEITEENLQILMDLGFVTEAAMLNMPVITTANYPAFDAAVDKFTPILLDILHKHLSGLEATYASSPFSNEISFEEYFMWWYHLYYSAVTDALIDEGAIQVPELDVSTYLMIPA